MPATACATGLAVRTLVEEGPAAIQELIEWGAEFDREGNKLAFTREGAHSRDRILHAHGDSTGREIARTLYQKACSLPNVTFRSFAATTELLVEDGVSGAMIWDANAQSEFPIQARAVLLATGGLGRVFLNTTNPDVATGDGVAMAYRAGAEISDIEFVQFHPTALAVEGAPRFLLSEALRGEGALLRNTRGERFMERYHPLKELAPRDVVARAIVSEMTRTGSPHVFLDLTHRGESFIRERFPRIYQTCLRYGVNIGTDAGAGGAGGALRDGRRAHGSRRPHQSGAPVCGGRSGVHRSPRRQSAGQQFAAGRRGIRNSRRPRDAGGPRRRTDASVERRSMNAPVPAFARRNPADRVGEVRHRALGETDCSEAVEQLEALAPESPEERNMRQVALLIARCALAREESRGAHFRTDYPETSDAFARHSVVSQQADVTFR